MPPTTGNPPLTFCTPMKHDHIRYLMDMGYTQAEAQRIYAKLNQRGSAQGRAPRNAHTPRPRPLTQEEAAQAREMLFGGSSAYLVAARFNLKVSEVRRIAAGLPYDAARKTAKVTPQDAVSIRAALARGESPTALAAAMNVSRQTIYNVRDNLIHPAGGKP